MKVSPFSSLSTRRYVIADPKVQGAIVRRLALYAFAAVVYYSIVLACAVYATVEDGAASDALIRYLDDAITWLPGLLVLGPIAAYDLYATTNRFAGPIIRLRRELRDLIDGNSPQPLKFREGDHWTEMAELFNELRSEIMELRKKADGKSPTDDDSKVNEILI